MKKDTVSLKSLPDSVVVCLRPNHNASLWYHDIEVEKTHVVNCRNGLSAKYRINTKKGQYRSDNPVIEILS